MRRAIISITAGLAASAFLGSQITVGAAASTPVSHFECYAVTAAGTGFKAPGTIKVTNKLTSPSGAVANVHGVDLQCAPAQQRAASANAGMLNPKAHQVCWAVSPQAPQPVKRLRISNQFGTGDLVASGLIRVCVPSWEWQKASGKPTSSADIPPGLSHYSCYSVSYAPGGSTFHPPSSLLLDDAVLGKTTSAKAGGPKMVCIASVAVVSKSGQTVTYQIQNATTHLLCFAVTAKGANKPTFARNQFGTTKLTVAVAKLLCEPSSSLTILPPTTTTGTPTTMGTTMAPPTTMPPTTTTMPATTTTEESTTTLESTTSSSSP